MLHATFKVVAYAEQNGKRAASRNSDVNGKCVRRWCDQKEELAAKNKTRKAFCGKPCKFPTLEKELMKYVMDIAKDGYTLSTKMLRVKALAIARHMNISPMDFKASEGWLWRFMKRQLSIRHRTTLCQRLPRKYDDKVIKFHRFVNALRAEHEYHLDQIGNADQTPVWFYAPQNTTVNQSGAKSVLVRMSSAKH
ncbi:hypothetical protein HPB49_016929 [Dermacentor silvarum]|uniref:Uncharacterized protein n=1 Tax=Dermacentor silvarum TaxID=543639 RepID=A0ACB8CGF4_DERSI|nr:hypothetical protein HPB49_016929 [Dermacentor silvarum]